MPIIVNLDVMMAKRKMSSGELTEKIGISQANLSILKTSKAKAIRFSTMGPSAKRWTASPETYWNIESKTKHKEANQMNEDCLNKNYPTLAAEQAILATPGASSLEGAPLLRHVKEPFEADRARQKIAEFAALNLIE